MAESLLSRKRDLIYFLYFCTALPIAFIVDIQPIYPQSKIPQWMLGITDFYINNYHDQNYIKPTATFEFYLWTELLYQIPVMVWGVGALYRGSPKIPVVLLPFACLIFISTATLMTEFWFWDVPLSHKINLTTLYGPYLTLSGCMLVDMVYRLNALVDQATSVQARKKRN